MPTIRYQERIYRGRTTGDNLPCTTKRCCSPARARTTSQKESLRIETGCQGLESPCQRVFARHWFRPESSRPMPIYTRQTEDHPTGICRRHPCSSQEDIRSRLVLL